MDVDDCITVEGKHNTVPTVLRGTNHRTKLTGWFNISHLEHFQLDASAYEDFQPDASAYASSQEILSQEVKADIRKGFDGLHTALATIKRPKVYETVSSSSSDGSDGDAHTTDEVEYGLAGSDTFLTKASNSGSVKSTAGGGRSSKNLSR
mmetsp:Transcript_43940/g.73187  ORF Transcript_43940/g.73187 Transcript_43940/m.73187 type:complete len:150 (-) Transcript_43940:270-719(-)